MTKCLSLRIFSIPLLLALFGGLAWSGSSWALSLQDAKAQGLVGEQPNGYLGLVKASAEAKTLIKGINAKRKKHYQDIARRNKTSLDAVEVLAGKKAIEKTPPGQYVKLPSGKWVKK